MSFYIRTDFIRYIICERWRRKKSGGIKNTAVTMYMHGYCVQNLGKDQKLRAVLNGESMLHITAVDGGRIYHCIVYTRFAHSLQIVLLSQRMYLIIFVS